MVVEQDWFVDVGIHSQIRRISEHLVVAFLRTLSMTFQDLQVFGGKVLEVVSVQVFSVDEVAVHRALLWLGLA